MTHRVLLDLARRAARLGAAEVVRRSSRAIQVAAKAVPTDPITNADRASEAAIVGLIQEERPADGIVTEEGTERTSASGLRWVVDALDGTVNVLYRIPHFAVSIACEQYSAGVWSAVVGVVHDQVRGETFAAARGRGAHVNGAPITVNDPVDLPFALVATEFSYHVRSRERQAPIVAAVLSHARDIRSTGSSALDLCWTAAGRFDAFYENELSRWDWSAGALIVAEAGGTVTSLGSGVLAAGPVLHSLLSPLMRQDAC